MKNNVKEQLAAVIAGTESVVTFEGKRGYAAFRSAAVKIGQDFGVVFRFKRIDENSAFARTESWNPYSHKLRTIINNMARYGDKDYKGLFDVLKRYLYFEEHGEDER